RISGPVELEAAGRLTGRERDEQPPGQQARREGVRVAAVAGDYVDTRALRGIDDLARDLPGVAAVGPLQPDDQVFRVCAYGLADRGAGDAAWREAVRDLHPIEEQAPGRRGDPGGARGRTRRERRGPAQNRVGDRAR